MRLIGPGNPSGTAQPSRRPPQSDDGLAGPVGARSGSDLARFRGKYLEFSTEKVIPDQKSVKRKVTEKPKIQNRKITSPTRIGFENTFLTLY